MKDIFSLYSDFYFLKSSRLFYKMENNKTVEFSVGKNSDIIGESMFGPSEKVKEVLERFPHYEEIEGYIEDNGLTEKVTENSFIAEFVKSYINISDNPTPEEDALWNDSPEGMRGLLEMEIFRALRNMKQADVSTGTIAAIAMGIERCEQEYGMTVTLSSKK